MPRLKKETKLLNAFEKAKAFLEAQGMDVSNVDLPLMSQEEEMYEAQAALNYFSAVKQPPRNKDGTLNVPKGWYLRKCQSCGFDFVYSYHYEGVKCCSIECMDAELRKVGLKWTRGRNVRLRWDRFYPAIVPSSVLQVQQSLPEELPDSS